MVDTEDFGLRPPGGSMSGMISEGPRKRDEKRLRKLWTDEEHARFVEGLKEHQDDYLKVAECVGTRTR